MTASRLRFCISPACCNLPVVLVVKNTLFGRSMRLWLPTRFVQKVLSVTVLRIVFLDAGSIRSKEIVSKREDELTFPKVVVLAREHL